YYNITKNVCLTDKHRNMDILATMSTCFLNKVYYVNGGLIAQYLPILNGAEQHVLMP
ncbi:hypothetical protein ACJX0J_030422, partial [Zea mays]